MSCETIQDRLPDLVAGRLDPVEAAEIERHLSACDECRADAEVLRALHAAGPAPVPVGLESRIRAAAATALTEETGNDVRPLAIDRSLMPRQRVPSWAMGAAAVLVLALGTPLLVDRMDTSDLGTPISEESALEAPVASVWASEDDGLIAGAPALETLTDEELALLLEEWEG